MPVSSVITDIGHKRQNRSGLTRPLFSRFAEFAALSNPYASGVNFSVFFEDSILIFPFLSLQYDISSSSFKDHND